MITLVISLLAVIWILCGVLAFGAAYGYLQGEFPKTSDGDDLDMALFMAMAGPIGLAILAADTRFKHGLKFRRTNKGL